MTTRPMPPPDLANDLRYPEGFDPAPGVAAWLMGTFIGDDAPLRNPDHAHLQFAQIGVLWTNVPNSRQMRAVAGTAGIPGVQGDKWTKARAEFQLREWFGDVPDFLITLDAVYCAQASDAAFCALVEHELYHCGQQIDEFGCPRFTKDGKPKFGIRAHDVEEFVGVVRRYGLGAVHPDVGRLARAAGREPEVGRADVALACGTCLRAVV